MRYHLVGLDCPSCAAKIEQELRKRSGLENTSVSFATQSMEIPPSYAPIVQEVIDRVEPGLKLVPQNTGVTDSHNHGLSLHENRFRLMSSERWRILTMIIAAALLCIGIAFNSTLHNTPAAIAEYAVLLTAYVIVGYKVVTKAFFNLKSGLVFDENTLMTVATLGAIAIHQLPESVAVMLFYTIGEYFQDKAVERSRRSIANLMNIRPDTAHLKVSGEIKTVHPEEVKIGQIILIKPGEKVPLDGIITEGESFVDTSALTGESTPKRKRVGDDILAGMINGQGLLVVEVRKRFSDSSISKILDLVETAASRKAPTEQFITKFARYYTPIVVYSAAALAFLPPLLVRGASLSEWVYRSLVLLVISCPCALVISIPLTYFAGIGNASRHGILVKGANYLDTLTKVRTVAFDKTGTLTKGVFKVVDIVPRNGYQKEDVLRLAAMAEANSNHPIAQSIREAYGKPINRNSITEYHEIPGHGVKAMINGNAITAGNDRLMHSENIPHDSCSVQGTSVFVALDGVFAGYIIIDDEIRPDAQEAISKLRKLNIHKICMLTGDEESVARRIAERLGVDEYYAELLPIDKVAKVEDHQNRGYKLAFVGDGINDAPVITRADIGVAMGGLGSDAAIEAADVVIMEDSPSRLATAIKISRHTSKIVKQNVALALGVKLFFVVLGGFGLATIWEAVFADVGVALLAVFNASRTGLPKKRLGIEPIRNP